MTAASQRSVLGFVLLLVFCSHSVAQQQPGENTIKLSAELVVVDVQVIDKETGRPVGSLDKTHFHVYEDGVQQLVTHFSQDELPLSVLLLLDISGSVRPILERIREGALAALSQLKPADEVAVMAFASKTMVVQDFTRDRELIAAAIGRATTIDTIGSGTMLNEAIYQGASFLGTATHPQSRRVLIAVTDDLSTQLAFKGHSVSETLHELFESGTVLCGLIARSLLGKVANVQSKVSPFSFLMRKFLFKGSVGLYAKKTGGQVMKSGGDEVGAMLGELLGLLRTRYALGYVPSNTKRDGRFRRIRVKVTKEVEQREGKLAVLARQGYYARRAEPKGSSSR